jgi:putative oxidoreductase
MINTVSRALRHRALGLLLIRVAVGIVFFAHGWSKVNNLDMVEGMFLGFGLPGATGVFIAWLEVIGGIAMILGVLTRLFGALFAIEMLVAVFLTGGAAKGYRPHELEIFLLLVSLGVALTGSGRWSIWAGECHHCGGMTCKGACCSGGADCRHKE